MEYDCGWRPRYTLNTQLHTTQQQRTTTHTVRSALPLDTHHSLSRVRLLDTPRRGALQHDDVAVMRRRAANSHRLE